MAEPVSPLPEVRPQTILPGKAAATYACEFYAELEKRANIEVVEGTEFLVFRGKLTDVFNELKASQTYYSQIRAILANYECVTILQRGTSAYESVLVLNHAPPSPENISSQDLTRPTGAATLGSLGEAIEDLGQRLKGLENWREGTGGINIGEVLRNFEQRLAKLERAAGTGG